MKATKIYSGAQTPSAGLKGLPVYVAKADAPPKEVMSRPLPRKYCNGAASLDGWPSGRPGDARWPFCDRRGVYSAMNRNFAREGHGADQHDAYSVAARPSGADHDGELVGGAVFCL